MSEKVAVDYLRDLGMVPSKALAQSRSLGGGISNQVIMVSWDGGCLVAKQPMEKLKVQMDWPADLRRIHIEASALRAYASLIERARLKRVSVPRVLYENMENHIIVMECIPNGKTGMWKTELLSGTVDMDIARRLGELLGSVQAAAAEDPEIRESFVFKEHFDELRIDPYYRTAASRNRDVADMVLEEARRVYSGERTLVHGDYSPKSVLVNRSGARPHLWVFDMEVAHWGDPSFDTGFMLNHLFIKSVHLRQMRERFIGAAMEFWDAYKVSAGWDIEEETVKELAVLMLARVDGKSPIEYLNNAAKGRALREIAKRALRGEANTLREYADLVRQESEHL